MGYCNLTHIENRLGIEKLTQLTDDEGSGSPDTERIAMLIDAGAVEIDFYIGPRVKLPVTGTIPPVLESFNITITIYMIYNRRPGSMEDEIETDYKNVIRKLERFSEGKGSLGIQPVPDPPDEGGYTGSIITNTREDFFEDIDKY